MQKFIVEVEEKIEKKMAQQNKRQIMEVHRCLNAFELRVLTWIDPTIDLMTLMACVTSLRVDMNSNIGYPVARAYVLIRRAC